MWQVQVTIYNEHGYWLQYIEGPCDDESIKTTQRRHTNAGH